ncbi:MAG: hypothetical protein E4H36_05415 [Spirochaetales bacterium]|nr:MAG: hypothetical protein E4H36_05415 [Spirochaetales bacterium]
MNKIYIHTIPQQLNTRKGFSSRGCMGTSCEDSCCRFGCDVDRESYDLMHLHRLQLEKLTETSLEESFESWSGDTEYLGSDSIRSRVGASGYCVFHNPLGKGCVLYMLARTGGVSKRIVPSICRLFPLTWQRGVLFFSGERGEDVIPENCDCCLLAEDQRKTALETQAEEFFDICALPEPLAT